MELLNNETIIKEGSANFEKSKLNKVGGKLYLTNKRIIFEAHRLNFGGKTKIDLDLNQLVRCQSGGINLISGNIEIFDRYHNKYTFIVYGRKSWADAIEAQLIEHRNETDNKSNEKTTIVSQNDNLDKIRKLKQLFDDGIITEQEFNDKKQKLLNDL